MARATVMQMEAAQGPRTTASRAPPTAWAVVPPGRGMLYIMTVKQKAAPRAISGISRVPSRALTLRAALAQTGTMAAPKTRQVEGLR